MTNINVIKFNSGELSPELDARKDIEKYTGGCRKLENMIPDLYGNAVKRPGTELVTTRSVITYDELYADYEITYISENSAIWGYPVDFQNRTTLTLDADVAVDIGGGIVGISCTGHPFSVGDVIWINGTTFYEDNHILTAGTTANQLQFTDSFNAETFDGTETVLQKITIASGVGRMAQDSTGILYYGVGTPPKVGRILVDGTHDTDFLEPDGGWPAGTGLIEGIKVSSDDTALYVYLNHTAPITDTAHLYKFDVSDGSEIWANNSAGAFPDFDMAIDADDNVYILGTGGTGAGNANASKYDSADGTQTELTFTGKPTNTILISGGNQYGIWVDDSLGIVITGGEQFVSAGHDLAGDLYNLATKKLDNTGGTRIALGGTYEAAGAIDRTFLIPVTGIVTYKGFIYIVAFKSVGSAEFTIFKLDSDLNVLVTRTAESGQFSQGLFVSLAGEIVVVSQRVSPNQKEDQLWFYDTDLNYLQVKIDGLAPTALDTWAAFANSAGNVAFFPGITVSEDFFTVSP